VPERTADFGFVTGQKIQSAVFGFGFQPVERLKDFNFFSG
jgi:hypothetical protein